LQPGVDLLASHVALVIRQPRWRERGDGWLAGSGALSIISSLPWEAYPADAFSLAAAPGGARPNVLRSAHQSAMARTERGAVFAAASVASMVGRINTASALRYKIEPTPAGFHTRHEAALAAKATTEPTCPECSWIFLLF
jgi:hypothetical protein